MAPTAQFYALPAVFLPGTASCLTFTFQITFKCFFLPGHQCGHPGGVPGDGEEALLPLVIPCAAHGRKPLRRRLLPLLGPGQGLHVRPGTRLQLLLHPSLLSLLVPTRLQGLPQ